MDLHSIQTLGMSPNCFGFQLYCWSIPDFSGGCAVTQAALERDPSSGENTWLDKRSARKLIPGFLHKMDQSQTLERCMVVGRKGCFLEEQRKSNCYPPFVNAFMFILLFVLVLNQMTG